MIRAINISLFIGALLASFAAAESIENNDASINPCISADSELGDSAFWAITSVELFAENKFAESVNTVNACFKQWGPEAGQKQKMMYDKGTSCPDTGRVGRKERLKIQKEYQMNDVSMALWAKARSLHELGEIEAAKNAYAQCMYMTCGRAWDPKGWYWSPAQDCAKQVQSILKADGQ